MPYEKRLSDFKSDFTFGGLLWYKQTFCVDSFALPPASISQAVFSLQSQDEAVRRCREWTNAGRVNTLAILHLGTQWENYPISHLRRSERVFIFTRWIVLLRNEVVQKSL